MESKTKEFLAKWRLPLITVFLGVLLVLCAGMGIMYGKKKICDDSDGVLAIVPGQGERCVQNFVRAEDCKTLKFVNEVKINAGFCRDSTGLYPLSNRILGNEDFKPFGAVE